MIDIDFLNIGNAKTSAKIFNENANEAPIFTSERETKRETQIKDTRMKAVLCEYQNRYKKKKINRHFDVNSRKRGGGMASPWKISLFSA